MLVKFGMSLLFFISDKVKQFLLELGGRSLMLFFGAYFYGTMLSFHISVHT